MFCSNTMKESWSTRCHGRSAAHSLSSSTSTSTFLHLSRIAKSLLQILWSTWGSPSPTPVCLLKWPWWDLQKVGKPQVKCHNLFHVFHEIFFLNIFSAFTVIVALFIFCNSGANVCSEIRLGTALHRQCYAHGSQHAPTNWAGRPDEIVPLPGSHCPGWALHPVSGDGVSELDLQHSWVSCASVAPHATLTSLLFKTQAVGYDLRYVLDGFPNTIKQAELLGSRNLIPLVIFELELETVEVLKRGLADKMKPNKLVAVIYQGHIFLSLFLFYKFNLLTATWCPPI